VGRHRRRRARAASPPPAAGTLAPAASEKTGRRVGEAALAVAAALPPLCAYLATLQPGIPAGDSGELIAVAATLGVAHPPGYPLYALAGHAWAWLVPAGSVAWRLNLLSGVVAAAAAGVLALAVRWLTASPFAALAAAWSFAFALPVWRMAVVAEVFAPNALLAALALLALAALVERADPAADRGTPAARWPMPLLAFLATAMLSLHHTLVLLLAPLALVVAAMWGGPRRLRAALAPLASGGPGRRDALWIVAAAAVGLLPLLHLPIATTADRGLVWGDADTLRGFLRQLLRADYGTFQLDPMQGGLRPDLRHGLVFLGSLPAGLGAPGLFLAGVGVAAAARRRGRALGAALVGFVLLQALFFTRIGYPIDDLLARGVVERFYVLPDLVLALLAGLGAAALQRAVARAAGGSGGSTPRPWARLVGPAMAAAALAWPLSANAPLASQRGNRIAEEMGRAILASLPQRTVLFTLGDLQRHVLEALTRVEGLRPDVTVVDQALLSYDWSVRQLRRRHPDLLPPLGRAERIHLRDGRVLEGLAVPRPGGAVALLLEDTQVLAPAEAVASVEPVADPAVLFARSRSEMSHPWLALVPPTEDRYSGLPGTRNLLWLDHLAGKRPVAFIGTADDSWALGYERVPAGLVELAFPRDEVPEPAERARLAVEPLAVAPLADYFAPWPPTSFEAAERARLAEAAAAAARALCHPRALAWGVGNEGRRRLLEFAGRFERLEPTPDADALQAVGLLRLCDPEFRDVARGRADLERYLALQPGGAGAAEARRALGRL
jgi:hypothetical protein